MTSSFSVPRRIRTCPRPMALRVGNKKHATRMCRNKGIACLALVRAKEKRQKGSVEAKLIIFASSSLPRCAATCKFGAFKINTRRKRVKRAKLISLRGRGGVARNGVVKLHGDDERAGHNVVHSAIKLAGIGRQIIPRLRQILHRAISIRGQFRASTRFPALGETRCRSENAAARSKRKV